MSGKASIKYFSRSNLKWYLAELLVIWILLSPVVAQPLYSFILFPNWLNGPTSAPSSSEIKPEKIAIDGPGKTHLDAEFFTVPGADRTVLISHGNAGDIHHRWQLINLLTNLHASVLIYDYEGYGKSSGTSSVGNLCADGEAACDYLAKIRGVPCDQIVLLGESIGCGITCHIAETRCCRSMILLSPFISLVPLAKQKLFWLNAYPDSMFGSFKLDNAPLLTRWKKPLLIVHGADDVTIPIRQSQQIALLTANAELLTMRNRGHNDLFGEPTAVFSTQLEKFLTR